MPRRRKNRTKDVPLCLAPSASVDGALVCGSGMMEFDAYLGHVAHLDMPLSVKIAMIRAVQDIMQSFVDRAFGDDPTQRALGDDGRPDKNNTDSSSDMLEFPSDNLNNSSLLTNNFRLRAGVWEEKSIEE